VTTPLGSSEERRFPAGRNPPPLERPHIGVEEVPVLERLQGPLAMILLGLVALGFVLFAAYAHYNLDQAPHRVYKMLAGFVFVVILFLRPEWTLMLLPFALPYSEMLPISPIPMLNSTNVLMFALLLSWIGHSVLLKRRILEPSPWNRPLLFFLAWAMASAIFGIVTRGSGIAELYPRLQSWWYAMMGFILFFVTYNTVREKKQIRLLAYLYCVGAGLGAVGVLSEYRDYSYARRVAGGMGDINGASAYFACAVVFTVEVLGSHYRHLWQKLLLVGALIGSGIGMILPASRGAIVACAATGGVQAMRSGPIRMMLVVVTGIAIFVFTPQHVKDRFVETQEEVAAGEFAEGSSGRVDIWKGTLEVIKSNPILGVGFGQLPSAMGETSYGERRVAHNLYLETMAEMGIPGIALIMTLFWRGLRGARKLRKASGFPKTLGNAYFYFLITLLISNLFGGRLYAIYTAGALSILTALVFRTQKIVETERGAASPW
jgi:O-antigen ligase